VVTKIPYFITRHPTIQLLGAFLRSVDKPLMSVTGNLFSAGVSCLLLQSISTAHLLYFYRAKNFGSKHNKCQALKQFFV